MFGTHLPQTFASLPFSAAQKREVFAKTHWYSPRTLPAGAPVREQVARAVRRPAPVMIIIVAVVAVLFSFSWVFLPLPRGISNDGPATNSILALARAGAASLVTIGLGWGARPQIDHCQYRVSVRLKVHRFVSVRGCA
jgi:hypothetical protein